MSGHALSAGVPDQQGNTLQIERYSLSLADQAADILRRDIIRGRIKAGQKLSERTLAARLDISQAPAREALLQLEKEGLLVTQSDGRHVAELEARDVLNLLEIRLPLEELAAMRTAQRVTPEIAAELRSNLEQMRQAVDSKDPDEMLDRDRAMHRAIWLHSGNEHLVEMLDTLIGPLWLFFHNQPQWREWDEAYWNNLMEGHQELIKAILSGNPAAARESVRGHIRGSHQKLLTDGFDVGS